ncbi:O-methyltransferase [Lasiosphaeris hirsuta]|uniref:O-methyltransferase n=1 Tax=Lasiosphaeris hirsuta TaxID=260670 RepID=A0AA40E3Z2_9PEZI|nr:O-methyltransferase [Lasiosphaeris hirsuta]
MASQAGIIPEPALAPVPSTMLVTLTSRARDCANPPEQRILGDPWAQHTLDKLGRKVPPATHKTFDIFVALRCRLLDAWTREFLDAHPDGATVLNLGCGLDSRALRLSSGGKTRWIDVDLPEVVELRQDLLPRPEGDYELVAASVTDDAWLEEIPADRPTVVVMEGLLMYIEQAEVGQLVKRICDRFATGQILADVMGRFSLFMQGRVSKPITSTGAVFVSSVDHGSELAGVHEKLRVRTEVRHWEHANERAMPMFARIVLWLMSWIPGIATARSEMRFEF